MRVRKNLVVSVFAFCMFAFSPAARSQSEMTYGVGLVSAGMSGLNSYDWSVLPYNYSVETFHVTTPYDYSGGEEVYMAPGYGSYVSSSTTSGGLSPELYFGYAKYLTPKVKAFTRTGFTQRKTSVNQTIDIYDSGWHDWTCYQNWEHSGSYLSETFGFSYETRFGFSFNVGATYFLGMNSKTKLDYSYRNNEFLSASSAGNLKLSGSGVARAWGDEILPTWGVSYRRGALGVDLQIQTSTRAYIYESDDYTSPLKDEYYDAVSTGISGENVFLSATSVSIYYSIFNIK